MKFRECELLGGRRFPLQKKTKTFLKLCETSNVVWKLNVVLERKQNGNFLDNWEKYGESNVWSQVDGQEKHKGGGGYAGLQDTVDKLARANGVAGYGHVLRRDEDVLRRVLDFKTRKTSVS